MDKRFGKASLILNLVLALVLVLSGMAEAQIGVRKEIRIPEVPGYVTIVCDLHMHTVFSDGSVWPTVRIQEAWREGLDALSITDHIEYQPHSEDIPTQHNRPYELAKFDADSCGLLLIRGAEITRQMPPGHFNAVFLDDADPLDKDDFKEAVKAAFDQGAFIFWNHPGWPRGIEEWFPIHQELLEAGWLHGIEVVNGNTYYPEAHKWCYEKGLTMMATSDIHSPIGMDYDFAAGEHRPLTLVLAAAATAEAMREALFERQTVLYYKDKLIGEERFLRPTFNASIEVVQPRLPADRRGWARAYVSNSSEVPFRLKLLSADEGITAPEELVLHAESTVAISIRLTGKSGTHKVRYTVGNLLIAPETGLPVELSFELLAPVND